MLNRKESLCLLLCLMLVANGSAWQKASSTTPAASTPIRWADSLKQKPEWYGGDEAVRIADNVLLHQRNTGGWGKNVDMAASLNTQEKADLIKQKPNTDSNIDNGATYTQLTFLARVYTARNLERYSNAFRKGVDYLLKAQYANGGWPQYHPRLTGYYKHITFNDGAMINVLRLLRDIAQKKSPYVFVDEDQRDKAEKAVQKGIECILKTQIVMEGKRTVWCAQHDDVTLAPAGARKYELPSLSGGESVQIVRFLMSIDRPNEHVVEAIESAITWFKRSKITGIKWIEKSDAARPGVVDRIVVQDSKAGPLWARFYKINTNRPMFVGRDGIVKYNVAEIEEERRNNYQWYTNAPAKLLDEDYAAWQKKWRR